jgi:hypothetical protein
MSKRLLQFTIAILGLVPISAGLAGVIFGHAAFGGPEDITDLNSHFRYISGIFLAVGIAFYTTVPNIQIKTARFRLLTALVFTGGLARAFSLIQDGTPLTPHLVGLFLELVAVPMLAVWQERVASKD